MTNNLLLASFYDGQGLGNQLWIYSSLIGLSEKYEMKFHILKKSAFMISLIN